MTKNEPAAGANTTEKASGTRRLDKMNVWFVVPMVFFYLAVGVLLIVLEDFVTDIAAWAFAAGLLIFGGWLLIRYFRSSIEDRLAGMDFAAGLILLLAGVLLICNPNDMKEVFPKVWGLSLIFGCFLKIQYAFDEKSVGMEKWWIMLIFAAVSLAIGILALMNRQVFGEGQHLVIGIFMIGEAVLDLVTYILLRNGKKKQAGTVTIPADKPAAEAEAPVQPGKESEAEKEPEAEAEPETQEEAAPEAEAKPEQKPEA